MTKTREDVVRQIDDAGVHNVRLCFTDVLGRIKGMTITRSEIEAVLEQGQGFDGSSVEGFSRIDESDLMAIPDPKTFRILPWEVAGAKVAMMFCDIQTPDGAPYEGDPRYILKKQLAKLEKKNQKMFVGPELEFFYFKNDKCTETLDSAGYFDYSRVDVGTLVVQKTVNALEAIGIPVECAHHEVAPSQHEIDLKYQEALVMADFVQIYRFIVKEIAQQNGVYATFMPKPIFGQNGSGMHCHVSLFEGDKNLFFDAKADHHLSKTARHFTAGLLTHVSEITAVLNQWVNSYKRLVPGYEAPVYISWGQRNRSSLVRIPGYRVGKEKATRIELRSPDPSANPYLTFALILAAGMKGIDKQMELGKPVETNIFEMDAAEKAKHKIDSLPGSLLDAITLLENSKLAKDTLGEHIHSKFIENKKMEWDEFRIHVSKYELENYLPEL